MKVCKNTVVGYENRITKINQSKTFDDLDSVIFEILCAAKYVKKFESSKVEFIYETSGKKSPDFHVELSKDSFFVECKKLNRQTEFASEFRKIVRNLLQPVIASARKVLPSFVGDIEFHKRPDTIDQKNIALAIKSSLSSGQRIYTAEFSLACEAMQSEPLHDLLLYPSPKYWQRYRYDTNKSDWIGIVTAMDAKTGLISGFDQHKVKTSTWLDSISWEGAIKYRVSDESLLQGHKKINYKRIFDGFAQLAETCDNGRLHVWYERDRGVGHRQKELTEFYSQKLARSKDKFSHLVFNETEFEFAIDGRYDLIEHAYIFSREGLPEAEVTNVFTDGKIAVAPGFDKLGIGTDVSMDEWKNI